jgi:catechol-2,3-dioxygenase
VTVTPAARFRSVVVDCPDPRALARFYAGVVGGEPEESDPDWVVLQVPGGPRLAFQTAPGLRPPKWPRADRNAQGRPGLENARSLSRPAP